MSRDPPKAAWRFASRRTPNRLYGLTTSKNPADEFTGFVTEVFVSVAVIGPNTFVQVFSGAAQGSCYR